MRLILAINLVLVFAHSYGQIDSIVGHYFYWYPQTTFVNDFIKLNPDGSYIIRHKTDYIGPGTKLVFEGQWELINDSIKLIPDRDCLTFDEILKINTQASESGNTEIQLKNKYGLAKYKQLFIKEDKKIIEFLSDSTGLIILREEFKEDVEYFLMGRSSKKISKIQLGVRNIIFIDLDSLCKEEALFGPTDKKIPIVAFFNSRSEVNRKGFYRLVRIPKRDKKSKNQ